MRHIGESIIGRRGGDYKSSKIPGDLYPGRDLEYGDIVVLNGANTYHICLPTKQCIGWWYDGGPRAQTALIRYSSINRACYRCDLTCDYKFVRYIREYKNIKTPEALKHIFDKYNIPYE